MIAEAPRTISVVPPRKPELKTVEQAARDLGKDRATIFHWLKRGWLTRYYLSIGRRRTAVDMNEVRALLENPPGELAPPKE